MTLLRCYSLILDTAYCSFCVLCSSRLTLTPLLGCCCCCCGGGGKKKEKKKRGVHHAMVELVCDEGSHQPNPMSGASPRYTPTPEHDMLCCHLRQRVGVRRLYLCRRLPELRGSERKREVRGEEIARTTRHTSHRNRATTLVMCNVVVLMHPRPRQLNVHIYKGDPVGWEGFPPRRAHFLTMSPTHDHPVNNIRMYWAFERGAERAIAFGARGRPAPPTGVNVKISGKRTCKSATALSLGSRLREGFAIFFP